MFHCQPRLETHAPKNGGYLNRKDATPECAGGIEFVLPGVREAIALVHDSETGNGRGRYERIKAILIARGLPVLRTMIGGGKEVTEAEEFVDRPPSSRDCG
jgi:hypothetical protein